MDKSITTVLGPPPPGVDLTQDQSHHDTVVTITIFALTAAVVAVRFILRFTSSKPKPSVDDWLCALALVPLLALLIVASVGNRYGLGKHIWTTTVGEMVTLKKMLFSALVIYLFALFLIKMTILMFYRRIFGMSRLNWIGMFLSVSWLLGSLIALVSCPSPPSYFWMEAANPKGGHFRYPFYNYYIGNSASNVVSDAFILVVPIPAVWRLNMRVTQKLLVSSLLLLGLFACVASIVRLHFLTFLGHSIDITWSWGNVWVWSLVEPCVGIVCACLPTFKPIIHSAMKIENLLYLRTNVAKMRRASSLPHLRKRSTNASQSSKSSRKDLFEIFDGKTDMGMRHSEVGTTSFAMHVESEPGRKERESLEEYLGPMFIRVQHEVEWTVDRS
ncbi:hypothetical protein N7492_002779 [Penicillium capsulatum]|uniref:Rhodopsin domain-containing protein n=1 Tax=Penicillium capsulatum TaxID=69766 RepID=A0A9W9IKP5_9EURO|nr:hypothetical protein N7492_002779 [Penicillium capsulatum]KAJ6122624.1 hypothetical protein N7512_005089 [Penicillium capsulatum]